MIVGVIDTGIDYNHPDLAPNLWINHGEVLDGIDNDGNGYNDDMESGSGNWTTGGTNDSWGITTEQEIFEEQFYPPPSPPHFWSDSPGVPYLPDTDS